MSVNSKKSFLQNYFFPIYNYNTNYKSLGERLLICIGLWVIHFPIMLASGAISKSALNMAINIVTEGLLENPVQFGFFSVIAAPILEEMIFRGFLTNNRLLFLVMSAFTYAGIASFLPHNLVSSVIQIVCVFLFIVNSTKIQRFVIDNYLVFYYLSINIFALVHFTNYRDVSTLWFMIPLVVLPQYIGGMLFGYVRNKYGLICSIFTHSLHNGVLFGMAMISLYIL
jgi:membrane protease YdiL (CAAX protease family)